MYVKYTISETEKVLMNHRTSSSINSFSAVWNEITYFNSEILFLKSKNVFILN